MPSLSAIALALGYESESAFSTAFKRVMGVSPRRYGRGRAEAAAGAASAEVERELEAVGYQGGLLPLGEKVAA